MGLKVLIVEDSPGTRELLAEAVRCLGEVEVVLAATGFEALRLLPRHRFALVITDLVMPDINGLELINFVKRNPTYRHIPLVVVTGESAEADRRRSLQLGASEVLVKPLASELLAAVVKKYLLP